MWRSIWDFLAGKRFRRDTDLDDEIAAHLAMERQRRMANGEDPSAAEAAARKDFGNVLLVKETTRQMWGWAALEQMAQDVRYALRMLRRSPVFTAAAALSLGLGIGANTAIFQLLDALRLRTLPVRNATELVEVQVEGEARSGNYRGRNARMTNAVFEQLRQRVSTMDLFAWGDTPVTVSRTGEVRQVEGLWVSGNFFHVLGVQPALGRFFHSQDDRRGCGFPGAVISHAYWQREYGGSPDVLRQTIPMGPSEQAPILGVAPPGFFGPEVGRRFDVALPICSNATNGNLDNRMFYFLSVMGRVRPNQSVSLAEAELAGIAPGVFEATVPPQFAARAQGQYRQMRLRLAPAATGASPLRERAGRPLLVLMGIVIMVLLIACVNVANMMLARASVREHEFGVRVSLGASRGRVMRQLLTEGLVLASLGAVLGLGIAKALTGLLVSQLSTPRDPVFLDVGLDARILLFTAGVAVASTLLFAVAPLLRARDAEVSHRLAGRGLSAPRSRGRWQRALLVMQMSVCLVLLVTALAFVRSFQNLRTADLGFRPANVLVANTFFGESRYPVEKRYGAYEELTGQLRAIPGVTAVSQSYVVPVSGSGMDLMSKAAAADGEREIHTFLSPVGKGYFALMGLPLLAGRDFAVTDTPASTPVGVVNQEYARRAFGSANPVGRMVQLQAPGNPSFEIIGVVGNSVYGNVREERRAIAYYASSQERAPRLTVRFLIRSAVPSETLKPSVLRAMSEFDPVISVRFAVLEAQIAESLGQDRLMATLAGFFALLAGVLAVIGLYGVVSYVVSQRRREFGLRMALGADGGGIVRLVLKEISATLAVALAIGLGLSLAALTGVGSLVYGVELHDPWITLVAVAFLAGAGLAASYFPARRAGLVPPTEALRS